MAPAPFLELLHGEERVRVGHHRVVLGVHLAELARVGLVLDEVEPRLAEQVLVLAVAEGAVGRVHVVGLAPGRAAARISDGSRGDLAGRGVLDLVAAAVGEGLGIVVEGGRTRGARGGREEKGDAAHRTTLARG